MVLSAWFLKRDVAERRWYLEVRGPWTAEVHELCLARSIDRVVLSPHGDLSALPHLPNLRRLGLVNGSADLAPVQECDGLEELTVYNVVSPRHDRPEEMDLRPLRALRRLDLDEGLLVPEHLPDMSVEQLRVMNWRHPDLAPVAESRTLREVQLDGVRRLRRFAEPGQPNELLEELDLAYGRGVVSVDGLDRFPNLLLLSLESVRVDRIHTLGSIRQLRVLGLNNCGDVPDLEWLRGHPTLEHFLFAAGNVVSGDLSPLDDLPSVRSRYVQPKRHYNRRFEDIVDVEDLDDQD